MKRGKKHVKRVFRAPLMGDPGVIIKPKPIKQIGCDVDLDNMSYAELTALALKIGISAADIYGMKTCSEHKEMKRVAKDPNPSYHMGLDFLWCMGCFAWWREKKPLNVIV